MEIILYSVIGVLVLWIIFRERFLSKSIEVHNKIIKDNLEKEGKIGSLEDKLEAQLGIQAITAKFKADLAKERSRYINLEKQYNDFKDRHIREVQSLGLQIKSLQNERTK